jgi:L-ribulokinase
VKIFSGSLVAGVDFGSDSVRVILVDTSTGITVSEATCNYPRWSKKKYCLPEKNQFRQHPLDYIEAFVTSFRSALSKTGAEAGKFLKAIGLDTTGSTPCPVNEHGIPLSLMEEFSNNPNAMFHLWKDHTAVKEAEEINRVFSDYSNIDYTKFQGTYSSEWFWAKILHTIRIDKSIRDAAYIWVEHCDWFPNMLIGNTKPETMYRSACAAGHKALWHSEFSGLPSEECLQKLDPYLTLVAKRYGSGPIHAGTCIGTISKDWAEKLGVNEHVVISGSTFDAHSGAVGAGITTETLVKVLGTSTVDMMIASPEIVQGKDLKQICGQAENSIIPGYIGIEAGQAAFGDIYAWYKDILLWPLQNIIKFSTVISEEQKNVLLKECSNKLLLELEKAVKLTNLENEQQVISIDWFNGRRYPILNENVRGAIIGLSLGSTAPDIYKSIILATVFGSKRIFDSFIENGFKIEKIIITGGIAQKSPYIMQLMADILNRPIMVSKENQTCARGAAIYATVAAGIYKDIPTAQKHICVPFKADYFPDTQNGKKYSSLYIRYLEIGNFIESL